VPCLRGRRRPLQTRDKKIFEAAAHAEGVSETDLAYDDVPMQWTKDAKEGIRAVQPDSNVDAPRPKSKSTARKLGMTTITLEYAAPRISGRGLRNYTLSSRIREPALRLKHRLPCRCNGTAQ